MFMCEFFSEYPWVLHVHYVCILVYVFVSTFIFLFLPSILKGSGFLRNMFEKHTKRWATRRETIGSVWVWLNQAKRRFAHFICLNSATCEIAYIRTHYLSLERVTTHSRNWAWRTDNREWKNKRHELIRTGNNRLLLVISRTNETGKWKPFRRRMGSPTT